MKLKGILATIYLDYADAIFAGKKTCELRRRAPLIQPGHLLMIYQPRPVSAVTGWATVERTVFCNPAVLWPEVRDFAGITEETYLRYTARASTVCGIFIRDPQRLVRPVTLQELYRYETGGAPQSWRYLQTLTRAMAQLLENRMAEAQS